MKLLKENRHKRKFCNLELGKDFLDRAQKAITIKEKTDKFNFIKMIFFCLSEDTINKMSKQTKNWEKIFGIKNGH